MALPSVGPFAPLPGVFSDQPQMPQPKAQGGMFGGGQSWQNALLAAVAGLMMRRNPQVANNLINGLQEGQLMRQKIALAQQERQQQFQDARLAHQEDRDYDINNPLPQQPDEITRHMIAAGIDPNSPQGRAMYAASLDPVVMTPQGPMTRSQLLGASAAGQPAPAGVTFTPIGGPTPQASGGFPGY